MLLPARYWARLTKHYKLCSPWCAQDPLSQTVKLVHAAFSTLLDIAELQGQQQQQGASCSGGSSGGGGREFLLACTRELLAMGEWQGSRGLGTLTCPPSNAFKSLTLRKASLQAAQNSPPCVLPSWPHCSPCAQGALRPTLRRCGPPGRSAAAGDAAGPYRAGAGRDGRPRGVQLCGGPAGHAVGRAAPRLRRCGRWDWGRGVGTSVCTDRGRHMAFMRASCKLMVLGRLI